MAPSNKRRRHGDSEEDEGSDQETTPRRSGRRCALEARSRISSATTKNRTLADILQNDATNESVARRAVAKKKVVVVAKKEEPTVREVLMKDRPARERIECKRSSDKDSLDVLINDVVARASQDNLSYVIDSNGHARLWCQRPSSSFNCRRTGAATSTAAQESACEVIPAPLATMKSATGAASNAVRGELLVNDVVYTPVSRLLTSTGITVALHLPVAFAARGGGTVWLTLLDALKAAGLGTELTPESPRDPLPAGVMQRLTTSDVLVHHMFLSAERRMRSGRSARNVGGPERTDSVTVAGSPTSPLLNGGGRLTVQTRAPRTNYSAAAASVFREGVSSIMNFLKHSKRSHSARDSRDSESPPSRSLSVFDEVGRVLSLSERLMLLADYDAGFPVETLTVKYNVSANVVNLLATNIVGTLKEHVRQSIATNTPTAAVFGVDVLMWRFVSDCRVRAFELTEKQILSQANKVARNLGILDWTATADWLRTFRNRHKLVDLRTLQAQPAIYIKGPNGMPVCLNDGEEEEEDDDEDQMQQPRQNSSNTDTLLRSINALAGIEEDDTTTSVTDGDHHHDDDHKDDVFSFDHLLGSFGADSLASALSDAASSGDSVPDKNVTTTTTPKNDVTRLSTDVVTAIVKTASLKVSDPSLSAALDTIRCYILQHSPHLIALYADLASQLAAHRP